jgi:DNA repair protein RecN (Recombination protein N)
MLVRLLVQNYALIERTELHFAPGLNILTGETGAGKSLLVGALGLILGKRADTGVLQDTGQKCIVEAEFTPPANLNTLLAEAEIDPDTDDQPIDRLILRREISPSGKSRAFVNDSPVNLPNLRALVAALIDIHGQHDSVKLMDEHVQRQVLDEYGRLGTLADTFGQALNRLRAVEKKARELIEQAKQTRQQQEFFAFQVKELEAAQLTPDEEHAIDDELALLTHAELISGTLQAATLKLYDSEASVVSQLADLIRSLDKVAGLNLRVSTEVGKLHEARTLLVDAAAELTALAETIDQDPARLAYLNERQHLLFTLKSKYQASNLTELIEIRDGLTQKLREAESSDDVLQELKAERRKLIEELTRLGQELDRCRRQAAEELTARVSELLPAVGLPRVKFRVEVGLLAAPKGPVTLEGQAIQPDAHGLNTVLFRLQTNEGMAWGTLGQVGSGGEISRILLAIKAALAEKTQLSALIFDEIDTGISGEVALKVGRVMQTIAQQHQLITITHLPQIASRNGKHFFIYKLTEANQTRSLVRELTPEERRLEIAKMMSGDNPSEAILQSAAELMHTP